MLISLLVSLPLVELISIGNFVLIIQSFIYLFVHCNLKDKPWLIKLGVTQSFVCSSFHRHGGESEKGVSDMVLKR